MAATYEVYTFGGGAALDATFHMINSVLGSNNYKAALRIAMGFGFIWVLLSIAFKSKFEEFTHWLLPCMLIYLALFLPRVNVVIVDRLEKGLVHSAVSNVPWGLAFFAHISSKVGDTLTQEMELASSLPDDLQYQKNGALFGSTLIERASQFKIVDPEFAETMNGFVKQCVFYDILNGMYTLEELTAAPNIWKFLTEHRASPYRAFKLGKEYVTCRDGTPKLTALWTEQENKSATIYGMRVFKGLTGPSAKTTLLAALPSSYEYITGISESAGELMRQNMMINAIESTVGNASSELDANAAITNYMQTRAETQADSAYKSTARQAAKFVPLLRIVFECLYYGAFPLLFLAAMLPIGVTILKNYFMAFVWIQSWGPLYAVLNILMTLEARGKSMGGSSLLDGTHALTLMTKTGIETINADVATLAGYLSISIPFIAAGIAKGVDSFTHLAGSILNVAQSAASRAAEEGTTGNINFGNSTQGVHAYNNLSANQHRTSGHLDMGGASYTTDDGSTISVARGGRSVLNAQAAHSNLPGMGIAMTKGVQRNFSHETAAVESSGIEKQTRASEAAVSGLATTMSTDWSHGKNEASSDHFRTSEQTAFAKEAAKLHDHAVSFSKETGYSIGESSQLLGSVTVGTGGFAALASKLAGVSAEGKFTGQTMGEQKDGYEKAAKYAETHHLRDSYSKLQQASQDGSYETSDRAGRDAHDSVRADFARHKDLSEQASASFSQAKSMRESLSEAENNGVSMQGSLNQRLYERLRDQRTPTGGRMGDEQATRLLNSTDPSALNLVGMVAQEVIQEEVDRMKIQAIQKANLSEDYAKQASQIKSTHDPKNHYNDSMDTVQKSAAKAGISLETPISRQHKAEAEKRMVKQGLELEVGESSQVVNQQTTQKDVEKMQDQIGNHMFSTVVKRAANNVADNGCF